MVKLNYVNIASGVSIDNVTGNVTLFNIIEEVRIPKDKLPISIPELAFVGSFTRLDSKIDALDLKLEYVLPDGRNLPINQGPAQFQGDRIRIVMRLNGMPIENFGRHKLRVTWKWKLDNKESSDSEASFDTFLDVHPFEVQPLSAAH